MKALFVAFLIGFFLLVFPLLIQKEQPNYDGISELKCKDCNLILIIAHGLRQDHLSSAGYFRQTSPNIDRIVNDGLTFDSLISTSSDFNENQGRIVSYNSTDLIGALKSNNYTTAFFSDGRKALDWWGFGSYPFDTFDNLPEVPIIMEKAGTISKFLKENKDKKFFVLITSFEIHHPHRYPPSFYKKFDPDYSGVAENVSMWHHWHRLGNGNYTRLLDFAHLAENHTEDIRNDAQILDLNKRDIENLAARYDEAIYHFDEFIGNLSNELKANNLDKKTIIAITSDVGLELFERNQFSHEGPYDTTTRLIFSIYKPGLKINERVSNQITQEDISPTLIGIIGFNLTGGNNGLINATDGKINPDTRQFVISRWMTYTQSLSSCKFVRTTEWKLIECNNGKSELYNLKNDPNEAKNLIDVEETVYKELKQNLDAG